MTDEQKIIEAYRLLRSVNDYVVKCFCTAWNWIPTRISAGDRMIVEQLIKEYGQETVRDAFLEARANSVEKLNYVRTVAKNIHEDKSKKKFIEKHEEVKREEQKTWNPKEDDEWVKAVKELGATKVYETPTRSSELRKRFSELNDSKTI